MANLPTSDSSVLLQATGLRFAYGKQWVLDLPALKIPTGVTWVGGGERRGKSTLLRLLAGDLQAAGVVLQLHGQVMVLQSQAYQSQVFWMDPRTTAHDQEIVHQFLQTTALRYPQWDATLQAQLLEALDLLPHIHKPLYMLSTGSKRKVWVTAALASGAALTLLDEPFAALDKASIRSILEQLQLLSQSSRRACVVADYEAPAGVPLAHSMDLGD